MNRTLATLAAALIWPPVFWLGGFDFNERGLNAVVCFAETFITTTYVFLMFSMFMDLKK